MPIIKKFKQGVYEHSNLFKIKNPTVTVGDNEVKEITPFRGVIQTQGDIISSEDFNEMQKNSVYFVKTNYSEDYGSGVDAYVINNLQSEQEIFSGLKLKFIIPKTNSFDNPIIVFKNNTYPLKLNINENIKAQTLKKDNIVNVIYMEQYFLVELVTEASETTSGISKIYSETEADTDINKIAAIVKSGTGDEINDTDSEKPWDKLIKILNHTKFLTIKNMTKLIRLLLKPATENEYGLTTNSNIKNLISAHAPRPDLSPYIPFDKGYRNNNRTDWVVRSNNHTTWTGYVLEMYNNENNSFQGAFHTNGGRAYYKVPNRNGGNWNEIMDNHDMAVRDKRLNGLDSNIQNVRQLLQDVINNHIREVRLVGYIVPIVAYANQATERNGYIMTGVINSNSDHIIDHVQMRILQFYRNGQWLNAYFA